MKLVSVQRISKFKQSDWLENTLILRQTKEKMQPKGFKKTFKLINNSVLGKTMEK